MNAAWLAEFVLEALGAYFYSRRRIAVLWIWLWFRALADLASFAAQQLLGEHAYNWCDYVQRTAQYLLLVPVIVWTVGEVLREHPKTRKAYMWLLGALALYCVGAFHWQTSIDAQAVIDFEIWAESILAALVCSAMGVAKGRAPQPWGLIACGLVVLCGSDLVVTILRRAGQQREAWYPLGAILALSILAYAGWRDWQSEARSWSVIVPERKPVQSVTLRGERMWVN